MLPHGDNANLWTTLRYLIRMNETAFFDSIEGIMLPLGGIAVGFLIFMFLREFWCWYFKINHRIQLLQQIEKNTRKPGTSSELPDLG